MRTGSYTVYTLVNSAGIIEYADWGPFGDPMRPIKHVKEAAPLVADVASGRLMLRRHGARGYNRLDAFRICGMVHGPREHRGRFGHATCIYRQGGCKYFKTQAAAAAFIGMGCCNFRLRLHFLPCGLSIFHDFRKRRGKNQS